MRRLAGSLTILFLCVLGSCSSPARDNPIDPVNKPAIEVVDINFDGNAVVIRWRYTDEAAVVRAFLVRRTASLGDLFPSDAGITVLLPGEQPASGASTISNGVGGVFVVNDDSGVFTVGSVPAESGPVSGWREISMRDSSAIAGHRSLYQVSAIDADGDLVIADTVAFRF